MREIPSQGRTGSRREYKPPPEVMALIAQRLRGELPSPARAASVPRPGVDLYTYMVNTAPEAGSTGPGGPVVPSATTALVARCIVAAEKLLGSAYTREQQVSLGIDAWGALQRLAYGCEAADLAAIEEADVALLVRFVFNTRGVLNSAAK